MYQCTSDTVSGSRNVEAVGPEASPFSLLATTVDTLELFPMFTLCHCISDAGDSGNGPRYCAKDNYTKCMYELRCLPLSGGELSSGITSSPPLEEKLGYATREDFIVAQQERLDALVAASRKRDLPLSIALPIDTYVRQISSSGERFVISVSPFTGLSLGDVIRSGWRLIEESDFEDILSCVEEYGSVCMQLPPHGNLTFSAILRQLNVRTGAAEASHRSRWVIGDWLLAPVSNVRHTVEETVRDLEWLLHSAFSKLNVLCGADGVVLQDNVLEARIDDTIERIRLGLSTGVWCRSRELVVTAQIYTPLNDDAPLTAKEEMPSIAGVGSTAKDLVGLVSQHQERLRHEQRIIHSSRKHRKSCGSSSASCLSSSSKGGDCFSVSMSSLRRTTDVSGDDTEKIPEIPSINDKIAVSKVFTTVRLDSGKGWQTPDMKKEKCNILSYLTELLESSAQCKLEYKKKEAEARKNHHDGLYSILLRSSFGLARRRNSNHIPHSSSSIGQKLGTPKLLTSVREKINGASAIVRRTVEPELLQREKLAFIDLPSCASKGISPRLKKTSLLHGPSSQLGGTARLNKRDLNIAVRSTTTSRGSRASKGRASGPSAGSVSSSLSSHINSNQGSAGSGVGQAHSARVVPRAWSSLRRNSNSARTARPSSVSYSTSSTRYTAVTLRRTPAGRRTIIGSSHLVKQPIQGNYSVEATPRVPRTSEMPAGRPGSQPARGSRAPSRGKITRRVK